MQCGQCPRRGPLTGATRDGVTAATRPASSASVAMCRSPGRGSAATASGGQRSAAPAWGGGAPVPERPRGPALLPSHRPLTSPGACIRGNEGFPPPGPPPPPRAAVAPPATVPTRPSHPSQVSPSVLIVRVARRCHPPSESTVCPGSVRHVGRPTRPPSLMHRVSRHGPAVVAGVYTEARRRLKTRLYVDHLSTHVLRMPVVSRRRLARPWWVARCPSAQPLPPLPTPCPACPVPAAARDAQVPARFASPRVAFRGGSAPGEILKT